MMHKTFLVVQEALVHTWDATMVPAYVDRLPAYCDLCRKRLLPGEWVLIRKDNGLLICGVVKEECTDDD